MADTFSSKRIHRKRITGRPGKYTSSVELLYSLVQVDEKTGCHLWTGKPNHNGYGDIQINYKRHLAHRLSYELHVGPIPEGMFICHKCDTRACVNPEHLFVGSIRDNNADKVSKNRQQRGEAQWKTTLTEDDVRAIRQMEGPHREVGAKFKITRAAVSAIKARKNWKHVA